MNQVPFTLKSNNIFSSQAECKLLTKTQIQVKAFSCQKWLVKIKILCFYWFEQKCRILFNITWIRFPMCKKFLAKIRDKQNYQICMYCIKIQSRFEDCWKVLAIIFWNFKTYLIRTFNSFGRTSSIKPLWYCLNISGKLDCFCWKEKKFVLKKLKFEMGSYLI